MRLLSFIVLLLTCTTLSAADSLIINRISPLPINENGQGVYNLSGEWLFHPAPPAGFEKKTTRDASWEKSGYILRISYLTECEQITLSH